MSASVAGLLTYLSASCTGTRTTGCDCETCRLYCAVQYHAMKWQARQQEIRTNNTTREAS